ncbi:MAG: hypothetical protein LBU87_06580 [Lactobacillales bacterium]|jgi:hypothetical protein|nr:hypothetical protein [Lactobacillales bacterium]
MEKIIPLLIQTFLTVLLMAFIFVATSLGAIEFFKMPDYFILIYAICFFLLSFYLLVITKNIGRKLGFAIISGLLLWAIIQTFLTQIPIL